MTSAGRWRRCPRCGAKVKSSRLEAHVRKVHRKEGGLSTHHRIENIAVALAIVVIIIIVAAYILTRPTGEEGDMGDAGQRTVHRLGSGPEDFWTVYPADHVSAGESVPFPSWVQDESSSRVLLVLTHSEGCAPCVQQQADIKAIMGDPAFQTAVNYIDLLSGGTDSRAQDCFDILDPEGKQNYIPLTTIVAKDPSGKYVWHSWEGVTGKANLEGWLRDAIYYRNNGVGA